MDTLLNLVTAVGALITAGVTVRLITLGIQMAIDTEDKSAYKNEIKNVLIVLVICVLVTAGGYTGGKIGEVFIGYFD